MSRIEPVKSVLVYADGRVEQVPPLAGREFVQMHVESDGSLWERRFEIEAAFSNADEGPVTLAGLEKSNVLVRTGAEQRERDDDHRRDLLRRILKGMGL